jgi:hypothetical protein
MRLWQRIREVFRGGSLPVDARDPYERQILDHNLDAVKADSFAAAGDGVMPVLPEATADELYHEFEHEQERPPDPSP